MIPSKTETAELTMEDIFALAEKSSIEVAEITDLQTLETVYILSEIN